MLLLYRCILVSSLQPSLTQRVQSDTPALFVTLGVSQSRSSIMNFARRISFAPKDYAAAFHKWNDSYYRRYFHARSREG